jgi:hypothetical protein
MVSSGKGEAMRKGLVLAAVVATLVPAIGASGVALAGDGGRWKKVPITFAGGPGEGAPELAGTACAPADRCIYLLKFPPGTVIGDVEGDFVEGDVATGPNAAGISTIVGSGSFVGKVKECGDGGFFYTVKSTFDGNTFEGRSEYKIVPQTGTGDLAGITGTWTQSPDSPSVHGWVRCKVRSAHS